MESLDDAVKVLARAVSCDPLFSDAHLQLAKVYIRRQWWDEALVELKKTQELKPDIAELHFHLGQVYRSKSWWDESIREYQKYLDTPKPEEEKMMQALDTIQQIQAWKKELQVSPSASLTKLIK
jgi:tetratricopeptide (TPR) repeat protein